MADRDITRVQEPPDRAFERGSMVDHQIASRGVRDQAVLDAMRLVPREQFVGPDMAEFAYDDTALPIEEGQTISQPYIVAVMLEALELRPGDLVLEVGAGSGYAAAVMSRIVARVQAIERYRTLAASARRRMTALGYDNVEVVAGDGTLGWPSEAPYDAIAVAAGGPEVPRPLLDQLAIGGRLVIPVGEGRTQELVRVRRLDDGELEEDRLGRVRFVPLIGSAGWAMDGRPLPRRRAPEALRVGGAEGSALAALVRDHCEPFEDLEHVDLAPLLDRIGDARVVLMGEASHGTSEFYRMRARITRELVRERGFGIVAIEADWPDAAVLDAWVRPGHRPEGAPRAPAFTRFPTWMWRNEEVRTFTRWLRDHNARKTDPAAQVALYGLDLYSLHASIEAVLKFLDRVDPQAAGAARVRYGCFSPWERDPAVYGRAASAGLDGCEEGVLEVLQGLVERRLEYLRGDGVAAFDAERNAILVREAERYYRTMYRGSRDSWNLRDTHMFDVLQAVLAHRGEGAKAVVWAHNSHVGDASATEMGRRGELNIGQLAREAYGDDAYAIGFGTHAGTVAAASSWDAPMRTMRVRPSHPDSYERICHDAAVPGFLLALGQPAVPEVREALLTPHLERAIGVVYRPDSELVSHYFQAALPDQFDEWVWFDETRAVTPLPGPEDEGEDMPETYPFAL